MRRERPSCAPSVHRRRGRPRCTGSRSRSPDPRRAATDPGITTGSLLDVPTAGDYQLYLVYNLADVQQTLDFVQQTLIFGGIALVALIGAVAYLIVRLVVGPVRVAAETSEKLAAGQLEERLPERGDDELATLARSFNRMADSLQRQIKQLADLSRVQQRFVSDVSHELRTPLTTIRLAGDVLYDQRENFPPATARTAELLHAQTERFELLLADLLEMSRYDAGAVHLETEPTNLVRLVEDAIDAVAPLAEEKQTEIRLVAPGGYFEADVDSRRIRRILQNLLGNAIDHGEGRPIVVYVDSDADAVAIAVRDYGVGMSHGRHGAGLRPVLAGRPVAPAHDRRHRPRPRDLARGRRSCTAASSTCGRSPGRAAASGSPSRASAASG